LAFVPAYRCGAVPDFHRIPFSPSSRGTKELAHHILGSEKMQWLQLVDISQMMRAIKTIAFRKEESPHVAGHRWILASFPSNKPPIRA